MTVLTVLVVGSLWLTWADQLVRSIHHHVVDDYVLCSGDWRNWGYSCDNAQFTGPYALTLLLVVSAAVVLGLVLLGRWTLAPLRQMTRAVGRFGPQNLVERTGSRGRRDELSRLAGEIDSMLDRVAAGYEGQRRFAGNASHELRTPLAVQRTLVEVGLAGDPTPQQLELLARQLLAANQRNESLIEGLLVLAESDQGLRSRTPQRLDEIAADAVALHADAARQVGVVLSSDLAPVTVAGEAALLERLLANLVSNGIKYNQAGGEVCVQVHPGQPVLTVTNSGPVVAAESVPGLFEPFRRARGDRLDHTGGAGLGLTIARSITTAHGGLIDARARPDGGLVVTVELPTGT
ncbi:HAMP domain-containing sensor histidine kinase [Blastococcus sp. TF02-09]|uniref:sensor histidine kinase n=1 Tax=Blastococcus sp. TF02-09 TaxID=2250576 RepID=UPI0018F5A398|nr:HAMP domain-containing sensor histidine kinase [Blastococcus sp. TF02-9]